MTGVQTSQNSFAHYHQDDLRLIRNIASKDHRAFETFYQRYLPRLDAYLRNVLKNQEQIEDIIHEVLLVVWNQAAQYRGDSQVSTWIIGIARNKALQAHARERRHSCLTGPVPKPIEVSDPERQVIQQEDAQSIRRALDTLSSTQQELLNLTHEHGHSTQAIATLQDCSTGTVHYRKQQAYRRLAAQLGE